MRTRMQALSAAAQQFRDYERGHRHKAEIFAAEDSYLTASACHIRRDTALAKADRNRVMAEMCEQATGVNFQTRVDGQFMYPCFGHDIAVDVTERCDRLIEEVFKIAQVLHYDFSRIPQLAAYVAARPVGEIGQEVGGTMVCLAALCNVENVDLGAEAEKELARIIEPETMAKIRAKQAAKPSMSPLPQ